MVIIDTCIRHDTNVNTLDAFLYGQIEGTYKLYTELNSRKLSIRFETEEDATAFKLKALDELYTEQFDKHDELHRMFGNMMTTGSGGIAGTGTTSYFDSKLHTRRSLSDLMHKHN